MQVFVRQITTYILLLPHVILMPRLDGEFKLFHVVVLSAKEKHAAGLLSRITLFAHTQSHMANRHCATTYTWTYGKMCTSVREPLAEALPTPIFKKQYYLKRKWTNRKDCIRWPVGRWWTDEKRGKDKVWLPPTHVHSEKCDGWSYWSAHWLLSFSQSGGLDSPVLQ